MLGTLPATAFACSASGVCSGSPYFAALQTQLNRVRPLYGLPGTITVDGKIGVQTLAAVITTAQAISRAITTNMDPALADYVSLDVAANMTPKMLSFDADSVLAAMQRNGWKANTPGAAASGILDPYGMSVPIVPTVPTSATVLPTILNTGPTALPTPTVPIVPAGMFPAALPTAVSTIPAGLKIAGYVGIGVLGLGVLAGLAAGVASLMRRSPASRPQ